VAPAASIRATACGARRGAVMMTFIEDSVGQGLGHVPPNPLPQILWPKFFAKEPGTAQARNLAAWPSSGAA